MNNLSSKPKQEIKTVINLEQKPRVKKRVKKVVEPKNYYLFFKNSENQPDFSMIRFNQKEQAEETAKTWEKKKLCILISVDELNEFILSKK